MNKISVIVPIYNVEQYLPKCIDSILNQTYKNLEIILVDDGSTDASAKLCDEYAQKDSRVVVLHKENGGASSSRNAGLDVASGEYIAFVDSDDWLDSNMYADMMDISLKYDADIVECGYKYIKNEGTLIVDKENTGEIREYDNIDALNKLYFGDQIWGGISIVLWNKIYKRTVLSGLKFINATVSEDSELTPKILYGCDKIIKINSNWYNFNIRPKSLSRSKFNIRDVSAINARKSVAEFFAEKSKSDKRLQTIAEYTKEIYYGSYYSYFCMCYEERKDKAYLAEAKRLAKTANEMYDKNLFAKSFKKRLFRFSPALYYYLRVVLKKYQHIRWLMRVKKRQLKEKFSKK